MDDIFKKNFDLAKRVNKTRRKPLLDKAIHHPIINDFGGAPIADHDMACAICHKNHAVLQLNTGVFQPCWDCQRNGWTLRKKSKLLGRLFK